MKGVLRIPQSSSITETSPSDFLVSYPGHPLGGASKNKTDGSKQRGRVPVIL